MKNEKNNIPRPHNKKLKVSTKRGHHPEWELEKDEKKAETAAQIMAKHVEAQKEHEEIRELKKKKK